MNQGSNWDLDDLQEDEAELKALYQKDAVSVRPEVDARILGAIRQQERTRRPSMLGGALAMAASMILAIGLGIIGVELLLDPGHFTTASKLAFWRTQPEQHEREVQTMPASHQASGERCEWRGTIRTFDDLNENGIRDPQESLIAVAGRPDVRIVGGADVSLYRLIPSAVDGEQVLSLQRECNKGRVMVTYTVTDGIYRLTTPTELADNENHVFEFGLSKGP